MPDSDAIRENNVEGAVALLKNLSEEQRDRYFGILVLTDEEKREVKKHLWTVPSPERMPLGSLRDIEAFQHLVEDVRRGKAILFLGAGVSLDAGMPSSGALVDALLALARSYRIEIEREKQYSLSEIVGLLERAGFRREVLETLQDRIEDAYRQEPPPHQRGVFRLLPHLNEINKVILTTNWDELIERAFWAAKEPVTVIRRDRELVKWAVAEHAVVKLHGDFSDPQAIVVSDTDYARIKAEISRPGSLAGSLWGTVGALLAQYSCIYVGYRLADENMNLLRLLVASHQLEAQTRNYVVGPFDKSEQQGLKDWAQMEVVPATAGEFFVALAQELAQFANRQDDLDRVFRREAAPFIEFYAPFGAGKHALLDEVERRAISRDQGWKPEQIARIDLEKISGSLTEATLTQQLADKLGRPWIQRGEDLEPALRGKGRVLLLFENTEAIEEKRGTFTDLVSLAIAPTILDLNQKGKRSRLILAGRYPVEGWPYSFKRHAEMFPLSPFSEDAVWEMVRKYVLANDPTAQSPVPPRELARQIYQVTGRSNPGFIKHILDDLMQRSKQPDDSFRLPVALTEQEMDGYLASFAETIHKEVWAASLAAEEATAIESLFDRGLCVLRQVNLSLLERLAQADVFQEPMAVFERPKTVLHRLKKCHLLSYEFPLEVVDPIVRRITSQRLRRTDPEHFVRAHRAAASAWEDLLGFVEDAVQLRYIRDLLYHQASYLHKDGQSKKAHWDILREKVEAISFKSSQPPPARMGETLLKDIEEKRDRDHEPDGELLDILEACLGNYYEELRNLLLKKQ